MAVNATGLVGGWTPGTADLGNHTVEIIAENSAGTDAESWVVQVVSGKDFDLDGDVDQVDFGLFQRCSSGDGIGFSEGCARADLSGDGDVDAEDFSLFWPCMAGTSEPPGC